MQVVVTHYISNLASKITDSVGDVIMPARSSDSSSRHALAAMYSGVLEEEVHSLTRVMQYPR
jgi:hypothetical protein